MFMPLDGAHRVKDCNEQQNYEPEIYALHDAAETSAAQKAFYNSTTFLIESARGLT